MPELVTMSIAVSITPRASKGLYALVGKLLTREPGARDGGVHNQITGTVIGKVVQARDIQGGVNF